MFTKTPKVFVFSMSRLSSVRITAFVASGKKIGSGIFPAVCDMKYFGFAI